MRYIGAIVVGFLWIVFIATLTVKVGFQTSTDAQLLSLAVIMAGTLAGDDD